jgi:hypothetical protein
MTMIAFKHVFQKKWKSYRFLKILPIFENLTDFWKSYRFLKNLIDLIYINDFFRRQIIENV